MHEIKTPSNIIEVNTNNIHKAQIEALQAEIAKIKLDNKNKIIFLEKMHSKEIEGVGKENLTVSLKLFEIEKQKKRKQFS